MGNVRMDGCYSLCSSRWSLLCCQGCKTCYRRCLLDVEVCNHSDRLHHPGFTPPVRLSAPVPPPLGSQPHLVHTHQWSPISRLSHLPPPGEGGVASTLCH